MSRVRVTLHGGLNEIGGNKFLVEDGEDRVLLDFGTPIGTRGQFYEEYLRPRTNAALRDLLRLRLLPHIEGIYRHDLLELARTVLDKDLPESARMHQLRTGRPFVHGILLTHAHVDHFQDLAFVDPSIPVHCSATTRAMLEAIGDVGRGGLESDIVHVGERFISLRSERSKFPGDQYVDSTDGTRNIQTCPEGAAFGVGPFEVVAVPVDHSVPGGVAFLVKTPSGKRIFYTGDLRFHGALHDRTAKLREMTKGLAPDLLLTEGTRIEKDQPSDDEAKVESEVTRLVRDCRGLAIAEFGWKDTTRFDTLQRVAAATGRTLVVSARLAYLLRKLDHLRDVPSRRIEHYDNVKVYVKRKDSMLYQRGDYEDHELGYLTPWDVPAFKKAWAAQDRVALRDHLAHFDAGLRADAIRAHPERYLVHLSYFESSELIDLTPPAGSRWLRCLTEPYSDEMALDLERQKQWLAHFGVEHNVRTKDDRGGRNGTLDGLTHVSGHAAGADLVPFLASLEAAVVAPIHCDAKNLHCFDQLGKDRVTFPTYGFREAATGKAVIEI